MCNCINTYGTHSISMRINTATQMKGDIVLGITTQYWSRARLRGLKQPSSLGEYERPFCRLSMKFQQRINYFSILRFLRKSSITHLFISAPVLTMLANPKPTVRCQLFLASKQATLACQNTLKINRCVLSNNKRPY